MSYYSPFASKKVSDSVLAAIGANTVDCVEMDVFYVAVSTNFSGEYTLLMYTRSTDTLLRTLDGLNYDAGFDHILVEKPGQVAINMVYDPCMDAFVPYVTMFEESRLYTH